MEAKFYQRHPFLKDFLSFILFAVFVVIGTAFIVSFIFRSFSVVGPSMETTLYTGDRLIVNRLPVTFARLQNKDYIPNRGQIIVFKNPLYTNGLGDEYIVKRVIAFGGESVSVQDGKITVYNNDRPNGFDPDALTKGPGFPTSGEVAKTIVPNGELFVAGDHREGKYSLDSRNGLGTVPYYDVIGPVSIRIYPFNKINFF